MDGNPDLKSGFHTDSNPNLTKNWDPDLRFQIRIEIRISDFKSKFNPDFGFQILIKNVFRFSNFQNFNWSKTFTVKPH
jgi:hypothetical protein